jgi:hypothetical protein
MKALVPFYCTVEKKKYKPGDEYTGSRKELYGTYVEAPKKKPATKKAPAKKTTKKK